MAVDIIPTSTDGTDLRIGIVVSRFNEYAGRGEFEASAVKPITLNSSRMSPVPALPVLVLTMKFRSPMVCLRRKMTSSVRNVLR